MKSRVIVCRTTNIAGLCEITQSARAIASLNLGFCMSELGPLTAKAQPVRGSCKALKGAILWLRAGPWHATEGPQMGPFIFFTDGPEQSKQPLVVDELFQAPLSDQTFMRIRMLEKW